MHKLTNDPSEGDFDPIDLFDPPEWYYRVGFSSNGKTNYQKHYNKNKNPDKSGFWWEFKHEHTWKIDQDHLFYTNSPTVEVTIKLMDYDNIADDLADVSAYPGGGSDDSTEDKRAAIYHGTYDLRTDKLTGDKTSTDGIYLTTTGDGKNNAKVWFSVTDSYDFNKYKPRIDIRPETLNFGEVAKGASADKDVEIANIAPKDPLRLADDLSWSASADRDWITLDKTSGSLSSGQSVNIKVTINTDRLQRGSTQNGNIYITSNDRDETVGFTVKISMPKTIQYKRLVDIISTLLGFPS